MLRPCYLQALDRTATRWAVYEVRAGESKALVTQLKGTTPEEASLGECVGAAVDTWRRVGNVPGNLRIRVELRP
jgi:hypothetical protein